MVCIGSYFNIHSRQAVACSKENLLAELPTVTVLSTFIDVDCLFTISTIGCIFLSDDA